MAAAASRGGQGGERAGLTPTTAPVFSIKKNQNGSGTENAPLCSAGCRDRPGNRQSLAGGQSGSELTPCSRADVRLPRRRLCEPRDMRDHAARRGLGKGQGL